MSIKISFTKLKRTREENSMTESLFKLRIKRYENLIIDRDYVIINSQTVL